MSEISYPYIEGLGGINMPQILTPGFHDTIQAASGRELAVHVTAKSITICDVMKDYYHMQALVDLRDSSISFGIYSKINARNRIDGVRGRHPDLFAREFIPTALSYFSDIGVQIERCDGNWFPGEVNYRAFMRLYYKKGYDPVMCAISTWAGQQFILNGFSQISREDIYPFDITPKASRIKASFHRG